MLIVEDSDTDTQLLVREPPPNAFCRFEGEPDEIASGWNLVFFFE
jgi:hypothetical protein